MSTQDPALIELGRDALNHFDDTRRREWLCTNGIGGFAAGTVSLLNTRRYHGLLFAALRPPGKRTAMVAKLDVTACYGGEMLQLATNEFVDGTIAPQGFRFLESFRLEGLVPVWTWLIADSRLEQRIWMRHGENSTYVHFTRIGGAKDLQLSIAPLCTYRGYHSQLRGAQPFAVEPVPSGIRVRAPEAASSYRIICDGATARIDPQWYWGFRHRDETTRGLDDIEDLLRAGSFELQIAAGQCRSVILTAEAPDPMPADEALAAERARQDEICASFRQSRPGPSAGAALDAGSNVLERLALAADQFLVERRDGTGFPLGKTVIAGYPWFGDWGRDTMIALPGLALATGRTGIAVGVLRTFARLASQGMLPNCFADDTSEAQYNTVDAALWFFVAVHEYLRASGDREFAAEIFPTLLDMLAWHLRGTRYGIGVDAADGLLRAGENGVQLTWMDARIGERVVTPRIGKPVEINALWYNAACIVRDLAGELNQLATQAEYADLATRIRASFDARFWFDAGGYLFDVVDGPDGELGEDGRRRDQSLRPNQVIALSLPYGLLSADKARRVVDTCTAELVTPVGLRSLAPRDLRYVAHYTGNPAERDGAYHQGTVWTWLLGPFVTAHYRVHRDAAAALGFLRAVPAHLREACIGQVSEIMDGAPPFEPRGCFAQAWAVAQILRAWTQINAAESR